MLNLLSLLVLFKTADIDYDLTYYQKRYVKDLMQHISKNFFGIFHLTNLWLFRFLVRSSSCECICSCSKREREMPIQIKQHFISHSFTLQTKYLAQHISPLQISYLIFCTFQVTLLEKCLFITFYFCDSLFVVEKHFKQLLKLELPSAKV